MLRKEITNGMMLEAAATGNSTIVAGAMHTKNIDINSVDDDGNTALMLAIRNCRSDIAMDLLERARIDVNAADVNGDTALILAAGSGILQFQVVEALLKKPDININAANKRGRTALMAAAMASHTSFLTDMLLNEGADRTIKDKEGNTAEMLAKTQEVQTAIRNKAQTGTKKKQNERVSTAQSIEKIMRRVLKTKGVFKQYGYEGAGEYTYSMGPYTVHIYGVWHYPTCDQTTEITYNNIRYSDYFKLEEVYKEIMKSGGYNLQGPDVDDLLIFDAGIKADYFHPGFVYRKLCEMDPSLPRSDQDKSKSRFFHAPENNLDRAVRDLKSKLYHHILDYINKHFKQHPLFKQVGVTSEGTFCNWYDDWTFTHKGINKEFAAEIKQISLELEASVQNGIMRQKLDESEANSILWELDHNFECKKVKL